MKKNNNKLLELLSERHEEWLKMSMSLSYSITKPIAQELVQDMYLRMDQYIDNPNKIMFSNDQINTMYVYIVLRNIFYTNVRNRTKVNTITDYIDNPDIKELVLPDNDLDVDDEIKRSNLNQDILNEINSWNYYDKKLFKLIFYKNMSMRKLSRATGISVSSIFNTIKVCKLKLKGKFSVPYHDIYK